MSTLLASYRSLLDQSWKGVFPQARTRQRAIEHAVLWPSAFGRRTVSQTICAAGRSAQDWSADYKLFSRSPWKARELFDRVTEEYLSRYPKQVVVLAIDDTRLPKSGRKIPGASPCSRGFGCFWRSWCPQTRMKSRFSLLPRDFHRGTY